MRTLVITLAFIIAVTAAAALEPIFVPVKIDGPVNDPANGTFWYGPFSEGNALIDVDGDGDLDITCGENWYEAPDWTKHTGLRTGARINGEFVGNCGEHAVDVDKDGRLDIVSASWFDNGVWWYRNTGPAGGWPGTKIIDSDWTEGLMAGDFDGDGDTDILVNHWSHKDGQGVTWLELKGGSFTPHVIGNDGDNHGCGLGDIDGDGRKDIVTREGWYRNPGSATGTWAFNGGYKLEHEIGIPMPVIDINGDGRTDIVWGQGHTYGMGWLEHKADGSWANHIVEDSYGQVHTFALADVNGDGSTDLIMGKRLRGHSGSDESSYDPLFMFWYEPAGGAFKLHPLSFNHLPWYPTMTFTNTVPSMAIGVGMNINVADLTGDGLPEIVVAGKSGLYMFLNRGLPPTAPLEPRTR